MSKKQLRGFDTSTTTSFHYLRFGQGFLARIQAALIRARRKFLALGQASIIMLEAKFLLQSATQTDLWACIGTPVCVDSPVIRPFLYCFAFEAFTGLRVER